MHHSSSHSGTFDISSKALGRMNALAQASLKEIKSVGRPSPRIKALTKEIQSLVHTITDLEPVNVAGDGDVYKVSQAEFLSGYHKCQHCKSEIESIHPMSDTVKKVHKHVDDIEGFFTLYLHQIRHSGSSVIHDHHGNLSHSSHDSHGTHGSSHSTHHTSHDNPPPLPPKGNRGKR